MKQPAVITSGGERVPGISSVWLAVGRGELEPGPEGLVCSNFMEGDFAGAAPYDIRVMGAVGQLVGHMLYYAILNGLDRAGQEATWGYIRQAAEDRVNHMLAGDGRMVNHVQGEGAEPCAS